MGAPRSLARLPCYFKLALNIRGALTHESRADETDANLTEAMPRIRRSTFCRCCAVVAFGALSMSSPEHNLLTESGGEASMVAGDVSSMAMNASARSSFSAAPALGYRSRPTSNHSRLPDRIPFRSAAQVSRFSYAFAAAAFTPAVPICERILCGDGRALTTDT